MNLFVTKELCSTFGIRICCRWWYLCVFIFFSPLYVLGKSTSWTSETNYINFSCGMTWDIEIWVEWHNIVLFCQCYCCRPSERDVMYGCTVLWMVSQLRTLIGCGLYLAFSVKLSISIWWCGGNFGWIWNWMCSLEPKKIISTNGKLTAGISGKLELLYIYPVSCCWIENDPYGIFLNVSISWLCQT